MYEREEERERGVLEGEIQNRRGRKRREKRTSTLCGKQGVEWRLVVEGEQ